MHKHPSYLANEVAPAKAYDKAAELRRKAEHLAGKIEKTAQQDRNHDIKKEVERLHGLAGKAKEARS